MNLEKPKSELNEVKKNNNYFNIETIKKYYDSNIELKEKYIEGIEVYEIENKNILEVKIKNNGLNHDSVPTIEQYEVLKFLTVGEYPNYKNISHVAGALGTAGDKIDYKDLSQLNQRNIEPSTDDINTFHSDFKNLKNSMFCCSPWNSWFARSKEKLNFIFRPDDLVKFLNNLTNEYFGKDAQEFFSKEVKKILNYSYFKVEGLFDYSDSNARPFETSIMDTDRKYSKARDIYIKEMPEYHLKKRYYFNKENSNYETSEDKFFLELLSLDKSGNLAQFSGADRQAFINLVLYCLPKYLKLIYDETNHFDAIKNSAKEILDDPSRGSSNKEIPKPISSGLNEFIKFLDQDDIKNLELNNHKIEEKSYAYSSFNSWHDYGFVLFCKSVNNGLRFDDASIVLDNYDINFDNNGIERIDQRVIFRFDK